METRKKKVYLKSPYHCPYCGSEHIAELALEASDEEPTAEAIVNCTDCEKMWKDIYQMVDAVDFTPSSKRTKKLATTNQPEVSAPGGS